MRDTLDTLEVLAALEGYLDELREDARQRPGDWRVPHKIRAVLNASTRIRLLARGGMRVIQGGTNGNGKETQA